MTGTLRGYLISIAYCLFFSFELSALSLANYGLNFLYDSLSYNHSNPKVRRMD